MRGIVESYDAGLSPSRRSGGISVDDIYVFSSRDTPIGNGAFEGTATYAAPKSGRYRLIVLGAGGRGATSDYGGGGGGGYSEIDLRLSKGDIITAVLSRSANSTISARGVTITGGKGGDGSSVGGAGGVGSGGSVNLTGGNGAYGSGAASGTGAGPYGGQGVIGFSTAGAGGGAASNSSILPGGRGTYAGAPGLEPVNGAGSGSQAGAQPSPRSYPAAAVIFLGT